MKTTTLPEHPEGKSPAGADIRLLMDGYTGTIIHYTLPVHQTNRAIGHAGFGCPLNVTNPSAAWKNQASSVQTG